MTQQDDLLDELLDAIRDARAAGLHIDDQMLEREIEALPDQRQAEALRLYFVHKVGAEAGKEFLFDRGTQTAVARQMGITKQSARKLIKKGSRNLAARLAVLAGHQESHFA